jgi:hypothetical protein
MRLFSRLVVSFALSALPPSTILAAGNEYELSFGDGGVAQLDFGPRATPPSNDRGLAVCPGPSGTLFTLSESDQTRFVSAWLDADGALDGGFGVAGLRSFAADSLIGSPVASCTAGGRVAVAWANASLGKGNSLHLMLVDPSTGLPDPAFGVDGVASVDLDQYASGLGDVATPSNLATGSNGDVLLFGRYRPTTDMATAGFALRVSATGVVSAVLLSHLVSPDIVELVGGGPAADGTVWVAADTADANGRRTARLRLDPETLAVIDRPQPQLAVDVEAQTARMVSSDKLAIAGAHILRGGAFVAVAWTSRSELVSFDPDAQHGSASLVPLPDQRLMLASTRLGGGALGHHFAQLRLTDGLRLDPDFGAGGLWQAAVVRGPGCDDDPLRLVRATFAHGAPAAVGFMDSVCDASFDIDVQVLRLRASSLFRDGFEAR